MARRSWKQKENNLDRQIRGRNRGWPNALGCQSALQAGGKPPGKGRRVRQRLALDDARLVE
jgi:hypothetical protein